MINITDLRIGNYIQVRWAVGDMHELLEIREINYTNHTIKHQLTINDDKLEDIVGIVLNETWLNQFGFNVNERVASKTANNETQFNISLYSDTYTQKPCWKYDGLNTIGKIKYLKYVHQLQNLYEDITKERLSCYEN